VLVLTRRANRFIEAQHQNRHPFFLWLAYNAPHSAHADSPYCGENDPIPATHADYRRYDRLHLPKSPAYNEADVSDKPAAVSALPPIDPSARAVLVRRYRCTAAVANSLDTAINRVVTKLHNTHQLDNTIIVYLSDNGFFFGEHRITQGKSLPYEPALQVPFAIRVPAAYRDGPAKRRSTQVVSQADVAPTLLDYAGGVSPCTGGGRCRTVDGRSLRPLLGGGGSWPADRGVLAELAQDLDEYTALRTRHRLYAEYANGARELYDLKTDPFELQNLDGDPAYAANEAKLAARLAALRQCAGTHGPNACE